MSSIFMKVPGVTGPATDANHKGWIPINSYSVGKSRSVSMRVAHTDDRESTTPRFTPFDLTKLIDQSSPDLFNIFNQAKNLDKVVIDVCNITKNGMQPFIQYTLSNVMISERFLSGKGDDDKQISKEYLALSYTKLEERFTPHDAAHAAGSPNSSSYDLTTAKAG